MKKIFTIISILLIVFLLINLISIRYFINNSIDEKCLEKQDVFSSRGQCNLKLPLYLPNNNLNINWQIYHLPPYKFFLFSNQDNPSINIQGHLNRKLNIELRGDYKNLYISNYFILNQGNLRSNVDIFLKHIDLYIISQTKLMNENAQLRLDAKFKSTNNHVDKENKKLSLPLKILLNRNCELNLKIKFIFDDNDDISIFINLNEKLNKLSELQSIIIPMLYRREYPVKFFENSKILVNINGNIAQKVAQQIGLRNISLEVKQGKIQEGEVYEN